MANYLSLWTSSKDPEFQQIKKTKQLTERRLAMQVSAMEKDYKRHIKKSNEKIRENVSTLEQLERDKEARARHILATYLKMQRKKAAASAWTQKYFNSLEQKRRASNSKPPAEKKYTGPVVDIVTTRGAVRLRDFSLATDASENKVIFPKIDGLTAEGERSEDGVYKNCTDAILSVARANSTDDLEFHTTKTGGIETGSKEMGPGDVTQAKSGANSDLNTPYKNNSTPASLTTSYTSRNVPSKVKPLSTQQRSRDLTKISPGGKSGHGHAPWHRKRYSLKGNVYVTFPFVYHSLGEISCPRYSLFRECTDYDPYTKNETGSQTGKMSTTPTPTASQRNSVASLKSILSKSTSRSESRVTAGEVTTPSATRRGSKRVSFSNVALAVRAVQTFQN